MPDSALTAIAFNCTLKRGRAPSSTDKLIGELFDALKPHGVTGTSIRAADYNILPGVTSNEGEGDDWPALRAQLLAADILIIGTPIWLGQPSSVANACWSGWMRSSMRRTTKEGCLLSARSLSHRSLVMRTVPITAMPKFFRRSTMSASRSRRVAGPIGLEKQWARRTTKTYRGPAKRPYRPPGCSPQTPHISPNC